MRQSLFTTLLLVGAIAVSTIIFVYFLPDFVQAGGPLVVALLTISIMLITFIVERLLTLKKAKGRGAMVQFAVNVVERVRQRDIDGALTLCDDQRGSCANILRAGLERFRQLDRDKQMDDVRKVSEITHAFDTASALEIPLLERNLIAMSTIASVATMIGLLGTTIGMIRAFRAMAKQGAPDAIQLALGISEALINTAGGLFGGIVGIVAYNFFTDKVDKFSYEIEETTHNVVQLLTGRSQ